MGIANFMFLVGKMPGFVGLQSAIFDSWNYPVLACEGGGISYFVMTARIIRE